MNVDELEAAAQTLFGPRWKGRLARALGRDPSTVRKYSYASLAVPAADALAVRAMVTLLRVAGRVALDRLIDEAQADK